MPDLLHDYIIEQTDFSRLDEIFILKHTSEHIDTSARFFFELIPHTIDINAASFTVSATDPSFPVVTVIRQLDHIVLTCACEIPKSKMCRHQAQVLHNIVRRPELRIFFDEPLRRSRLSAYAKDYG